jgi:UDP-N-acetyl-2-amino-2-deoxyglucuronate dehydrogenase
MPDKAGFGLLGAGLVAPFHAKSIINSEKCELIAVVDVDQARANKFSREFNCRVYDKLDDLIQDKKIQIINVLTPNHLHKDAVLKIAQSKKHILVEKPPALSLKDVDEMIAVCDKYGVKLGVVLQCRIRPAVQAVKKAIDTGRFGNVLQADAYMKWYRTIEYYHSDPWRSQRRSGAGVTIQHAFHYFDLLHYLNGQVAEVYTRMSNLMHQDVELEDTVMAFLKYENGAQGVLQASTAFYPGMDVRIEICGTEGTAIIVGERIDTWQFKTELPEDAEIRTIGSTEVETAATGPAAFSFKDHQVVIEDMVDAILNDREPMIPAAATRHTLELALAMYRSDKLGKAVELPLKDEEDVW